MTLLDSYLGLSIMHFTALVDYDTFLSEATLGGDV